MTQVIYQNAHAFISSNWPRNRTSYLSLISFKPNTLLILNFMGYWGSGINAGDVVNETALRVLVPPKGPSKYNVYVFKIHDSVNLRF